MSDFDEVARETKQVKCSIALAVADMTDQQVSDLTEALAQHSSPVISKVLRQWGFQISEHSVQRHRKKRCMCE